MVLFYILYALGFGYALRATADIAPTSRPAVEWVRRIVLAALFPLFIAAAATMAVKDYLERRAQSPRGDEVGVA